ncbi:hypothetical protein E2F46_16585 [Luteimonas aestuarii]|uniref:TerB family tellurite resistance protein n=1 Tax=Luteimonas aestuarii TaxID=453837 RepID=A0A4R5TSN6_9GAMM|nr:hypothetical protein [Luteimonas aestuarii]TDK19546.1 hypothetical protein E2F46_16585 [Luteimonas aestuarii]
MPERLPPHLQLALASVPVFTNDGKLDLGELERLLALALADHVLDDDEKRVVANVLDRAEADGVDADVLLRIQEIRSEHALG